jgi:hypothetical protein
VEIASSGGGGGGSSDGGGVGRKRLEVRRLGLHVYR